jgi:predicted nucleic acid-binding protein
MTVVIADTSPVNYLVLIGQIDLLPRLYGRILVPPEVIEELSAPGTPDPVVNWARTSAEWLEVRVVREREGSSVMPQLDRGERTAIFLAQEQTDALLLIDDAAGRAEATRLHIPSIGTLGILNAAAILRLVDLPAALAALAATNFRISQTLLDSLIAADDYRRRQEP